MPCDLHKAASAYSKTAYETASPRQLEARLLLKAASLLQGVLDAWSDKPPGLHEAIFYNRRLWLVFIDAVIRDDNKLPSEVRQNILNVGAFILAETFSLMTRPKPEHLVNIIRINRRIAMALGGPPKHQDRQQAA